jgi:hypothetical protein
MITAIDTNILFDIVNEDERFTAGSIAALLQARRVGVAVICDIVYAEVCAAFNSKEQCDRFLARLQIKAEGLDGASSFIASRSWISYLKSGGKRLRILPDFLIAAHALSQADRLLTRDRGFFRTYFPKLEVLDPTKT